MTTTTKTRAKAVYVTAAFCKAEIGRLRNNRARRRNGETPVRSASWKTDGLSKAQFQALLDGEVVRREFKSGRVINLRVKG